MAQKEQDKIDALVQMLITQKDKSGNRSIEKYDREWLIESLQGEILQIVEKKFAVHSEKGLDVVDFVKVMLSIFEHSQEETIYIVLELIELFKMICENQNLKDVIRFKNLTDYIIEVLKS